MPRIGRIADREIDESRVRPAGTRSGASAAAECGQTRGHFSDQPERQRAQDERLHLAVGVWPQRRAELAPTMRPAPQGWPRGSLHAGSSHSGAIDSGTVPKRTRSQTAARACAATPTCGSNIAAFVFLFKQLEIRRVQRKARCRRRMSLPERHSGRGHEKPRACNWLRVRSANAAPPSSPVASPGR